MLEGSKGVLRSRFEGARQAAFGAVFSAALLCAGASAASAQTIYDSQVLERMEFSPAQRAQVEKIIEESDKLMAEIFQRYGIDPEAKPDFDKLYEARHELQDLEANEKRKMKAILSRQQFKYYMGLLQQTAANVIRATRNKP